MRYLYGEADEKFVRTEYQKKEKPSALAQYKFRLKPIIEGKSSVVEFDKADVPIVFKISPDKLLNLCVDVIDAMPLVKIYEWNIEDICKWLRECGYRFYQNTFRENLITGRTLLLLDVSALSAMNIKDFNHAKDIARRIRSLFYFEMTKFGRSISLYPEFHMEVYKLLRIKTGAKFDMRRSDLWRKLQMIREQEPNYSHWEILERWVNFVPDRKYQEVFGGIHRSKLYSCPVEKPRAAISTKRVGHCSCFPPCSCYANPLEYRRPWRFKCLSHLGPDLEFVENCDCCVPPCTCRWSSKKYQMSGVLTCLQKNLPNKYGGLPGQGRHRGLELLPRHSYLLNAAEII